MIQVALVYQMPVAILRTHCPHRVHHGRWVCHFELGGRVLVLAADQVAVSVFHMRMV